MSWNWYSTLSDAFQKRAGRYLINRYLGAFLEDGILLDQLSVDAGDIKLRNVSLNIKTINTALEESYIPIELVDGFIGELSVSIPWSNLLTDHCHFSLESLTLSLSLQKPQNSSQFINEFSTSIFHSMYESFSSIALAEVCVDNMKENDTHWLSLDSTGGVEMLAQTIDSIVNRVQIKMKDTTVRLEYVPGLEPKGIALEIKLDSFVYSGSEIGSESLLAPAVKTISFEGVSLFTDEFVFSEKKYEGEEEEEDKSYDKDKKDDNENIRPPLQFASLVGKHQILVRFSEDKNMYGLPKRVEEFSFDIGILIFHLFPHQIHTISEILSVLSLTGSSDSRSSGNKENKTTTTSSFTPSVSVKSPGVLGCFLKEDEKVVVLRTTNRIETHIRVKSFFSKIPPMTFAMSFQELSKKIFSSSVYPLLSSFNLFGAPLSLCFDNREEKSILLSIGNLSLYETFASSSSDYALLSFTPNDKTPDVKALLKTSETSFKIQLVLNPWLLNFDLGLSDRVYLLCHYFEMAPEFLQSVSRSSKNSSYLELHLSTSSCQINFSFPSLDLRDPKDFETPSYLSYFNSRNIAENNESLQLSLKDVSSFFSVTQNKLYLEFKSDSLIEICMQEMTSYLPCASVTRSKSGSKSFAGKLKIMSNEGQERDENIFKGTKETGRGTEKGDYYVSDSGVIRNKGENKESRNYIRQGLDFAQLHHNFYIELELDNVQIFFSSKAHYEKLVNRLGNDVCLWSPEIYRLKKYIYGIGPQESDSEFSNEFANQTFTQENDDDDEEEKENQELKIDNFFTLSFEEGSCTFTHSLTESLQALFSKGQIRTVVGKGRKRQGYHHHHIHHEMQSLSISIVEISFSTLSLLLNSQPLVSKSDFSSRAWPNFTSVLPSSHFSLCFQTHFDERNNVKVIQYLLFLEEIGVYLNSFETSIHWILEFFSIIEYPIKGYTPPSLRNQIQVSNKRFSLRFQETKLTVVLGSSYLHLNSHPESENVFLCVSCDDVAVFLSVSDPVKDSICFLQIDTMELRVFLRAHSKIMDSEMSVNVISLTTCADTISLLRKIFVTFSLFSSSSKSSEGKNENENKDKEEKEMEEHLPDLEDALEDVSPPIQNYSPLRSFKSSNSSSKVFHFPDEKNQIPSSITTTTNTTTNTNSSSFHSPQLFSSHSDEKKKKIQENPVDENHDDDESFIILDHEIGTGISESNGEPSIRQLTNDPIIFLPNYFSQPEMSLIDYLKTPKSFPPFKTAFTLKKMSFEWRIYGGFDFSSSASSSDLPLKTQLLKMGMSERTREKQDYRKTPRLCESKDLLRSFGGRGRIHDQLIEIHINRISCKHEVFSSDSPLTSRNILLISNLEILDKLSVSQINKLCMAYSSPSRPLRSSAPFLSLKVVNSRVENGVETSIRVSLQPLRINIDQDTLFFLIDFAYQCFPENEDYVFSSNSSSSNFKSHFSTFNSNSFSSSSSLFIKSFVFSPDVVIRIDYLGKYIDLTQGTLRGLLVGLAQLNCSELTLKSIFLTDGILGLQKLLSLLLDIWSSDIKTTQVTRLLCGVGPMYSLLQLLQGLKDLILLPLEQYRKDHRIFRGLQRGAFSFSSTTTLSLLDLTNNFLGAIQFAAEMAFELLAPEFRGGKGFRRRQLLTRPGDIREGLNNALSVVRNEFDETTMSLEESIRREERGLGYRIGGVLRQVPCAFMRPVIVASAATSNLLEGVKNQMAPDSRKEESEKWK